jgi:HSP20 family molecular chaperone IbpA
MSQKTDTTIKDGSIRRKWDESEKVWYFSVVDVIAVATESSDPRNYWKVLKSRLNKVNKELVTRCNQLKMPSTDGKSYLTDTATSETILEILQDTSVKSLTPFKRWFEIIEQQHTKDTNVESVNEAELTIDVYDTIKDIVIESMIAGVMPGDLSITVTCSEVIIRGKRLPPVNIESENYLMQEMYWGEFARIITLPCEIDIDETEATEEHGLLRIMLPKVNKLRTRIIKIKK